MNTQPWDQQPDESDRLYSYFLIYKEIPTHIRTIKKTCETLKDNDKKLNLQYLQNVAHEHKWKQRVKAWDKHTQSLMVKGKESSILEMNNRHADISKDCIQLVYDELMNPELRDQDPLKKPYLIQALIRGLEGAVRIERLSLGESTSNTRQVNEGINNLMMVLTDSKKELIKHQDKERMNKDNDNNTIDIEYTKKDD